jgi:pimeloyl-ACP methyl ester carboxylesterase
MLNGRKKKFLNKKNRLIFLFLLAIAIAIFIISFMGFKKTIFNLDPIINGIPQSKIASDIRIDLIKNKKALEVSFNTKDGFRISGLAFLRSRPLANLIVCHGYRGCKESMHRFADHFSDFNVLLFDFRAHGQSSGDFTSIGYFESNDVLAAADFFKAFSLKHISDSKISNLPMVLLGLSMGGAAILKAVDKDPSICNAVIVDSSYADLYSEIVHAVKLKAGLPRIPFLWVMQKMGNYMLV